MIDRILLDNDDDEDIITRLHSPQKAVKRINVEGLSDSECKRAADLEIRLLLVRRTYAHAIDHWSACTSL